MREAWQGGSPTQLGAVLRLDVQGAPTAAARALAGRVLRLLPKARIQAQGLTLLGLVGYAMVTLPRLLVPAKRREMQGITLTTTRSHQHSASEWIAPLSNGSLALFKVVFSGFLLRGACLEGLAEPTPKELCWHCVYTTPLVWVES